MGLNALKDYMGARGIGALLVPINDEFFGEEIIEANERLKYITGFTGSAGLVIVILGSKAQFFTDGRYLAQAARELDPEEFDIQDISQVTPWDWANNNLGVGLCYDPALHTPKQISQYKCRLSPLENNPIDAVWGDARPVKKSGKAFIHKQASVSSADKRKQVLQKTNGLPYLITDPDSLCWLLNVRGDDLKYDPVVLAFGILYPDGSCKVFADCADWPALEGVSIHPMNVLCETLGKIAKISLDPDTVSCRILEAVNASVALKDPCLLPRACRNSQEVEGLKKVHLQDGLAITNFLYWLYHNEFTEAAAEQKLHELRSQNRDFWGASFKSIAAYGPNAALIHYSGNTAEPIIPGSVFLIDAGGQYPEGTTDFCRTIPVGKVMDRELKRHYTLVLKGHVALATIAFPRGTSGKSLDVLARQFLWKKGLNYAHGTGHGVGLFLTVHEGPHGTGSDQELLEGMVMSNEPGFYKVGHYGIRIENLVLCVDQGEGFLGFETLTCAPINVDLLDVDLLEKEETDWLNWYNNMVVERLAPHLSSEVKEWLSGWCLIKR